MPTMAANHEENSCAAFLPRTANSAMSVACPSDDPRDDPTTPPPLINAAYRSRYHRIHDPSYDEEYEGAPSSAVAPYMATTNTVTSHDARHHWQDEHDTLASRMAYLFVNDTMSDVTFLVGTNDTPQKIPAHRFILCAGSCVFDAMLNGAISQPTDQPIRIVDVEPAIFLVLLRYLYTDEIKLAADNVTSTLYVAKKYNVLPVEKACVHFLQTNLCPDNAFMLLSQARLFDEHTLSNTCLELIDKKASDAFSSECFSDIDLDTLRIVLSRDSLIMSEIVLFDYLMLWADNECHRQLIDSSAENKRRVVGETLELIRFPLMSIEEFSAGVARTSILNDKDLVDLYLHFTLINKPEIKYSNVPRSEVISVNSEEVVSRFGHYESRWGYNGVSDRIRVCVNRHIRLLGFGLYGSVHATNDYSVTIKVVTSKSLKIIVDEDMTFKSTGTPTICRVKLASPVILEEQTLYTISCTIKGPDSYYGMDGKSSVTHRSSYNGKVTFTFSHTAGHNNGTTVTSGQIPQLIYNII